MSGSCLRVGDATAAAGALRTRPPVRPKGGPPPQNKPNPAYCGAMCPKCGGGHQFIGDGTCPNGRFTDEKFSASYAKEHRILCCKKDTKGIKCNGIGHFARHHEQLMDSAKGMKGIFPPGAVANKRGRFPERQRRDGPRSQAFKKWKTDGRNNNRGRPRPTRQFFTRKKVRETTTTNRFGRSRRRDGIRCLIDRSDQAGPMDLLLSAPLLYMERV